MEVSDIQREFIIREDDLWWRDPRGRRSSDSPAGGIDTSNGYRVVNFMGGKRYVHRIIFALRHGYMPYEVDHINGVKTDNRVENLRAVTSSQNKMNVKIRKDNTHGEKGICFHNGRNKPWQAVIQFNCMKKSLGYYHTLDECKAARRAAEDKYFGEYAHDR